MLIVHRERPRSGGVFLCPKCVSLKAVVLPYSSCYNQDPLYRPEGVFVFPVYPGAMRFSTVALASLATLRLTRFITTDTLGGWSLVEPAVRWATKNEGGFAIKEGSELVNFHQHEFSIVNGHIPIQVDEDRGWRSKLVSGLECPHCVGYWIGAAALLSGAVMERKPLSRRVYGLIAGSLGLSYVTGHVSQRLDN